MTAPPSSSQAVAVERRLQLRGERLDRFRASTREIFRQAAGLAVSLQQCMGPKWARDSQRNRYGKPKPTAYTEAARHFADYFNYLRQMPTNLLALCRIAG